jgi:hypothetical protein
MKTFAVAVITVLIVAAGVHGQTATSDVPAKDAASAKTTPLRKGPQNRGKKTKQLTPAPTETTPPELDENPATVTAPREPQPPTRKPNGEHFDLMKEQQAEHPTTLIKSIASDVERINSRLLLLTVMGSAILAFSAMAAILSALAFVTLLRSRVRRQRTVYSEYPERRDNFTPDFNRRPSGSGQSRDYDYPGNDFDNGSNREKPIAPAIQPTQPSPERPARASFAPKTTPLPNKNYGIVDKNILMSVGATCLDFPQSIEDVRRLWRERGGDQSVEIVGYGEGPDEPSVILVGSRDRGFFGVPNTNDWANLSETGLFDPDGRVGPGTRVRELQEVAQVKRSHKGVFTIVQEGKVRVDL